MQIVLKRFYQSSNFIVIWQSNHSSFGPKRRYKIRKETPSTGRLITGGYWVGKSAQRCIASLPLQRSCFDWSFAISPVVTIMHLHHP